MPKILVIDDEASMRKLLVRGLGHAGYEVSDTGSGAVGIELAVSERPDLVLCDVGLEDISGYDVLRLLREQAETCSIPVILITGLADLQGMREGMRLGADDYVPKPFDLPDLVNVIAARLQKTESLRREAGAKAKALRSHISMMLPQELLTPLNGIIGLADLLRTDAETLRSREAAEIGRDIQNAGERLHRQIRNFLIYSQLELLTVEPERLAALREAPPARAAKVVEEVATRVAERHGRRTDLELALGAAEVAIGEHNLAKLTEELLDNAFRFSAAGRTVQVRTRVTDDKLWLTVSDEGRGIAPEIVANLHAPDQFDRLWSERQPVGLGLPIAIKLAELHLGRAVIQSQPGTGTVILIELPLAPATRPR